MVHRRAGLGAGKENSAMFKRRLRWLTLALALTLIAGAVTLWLLTPPRIDRLIHVGMTRADVEVITGKPPNKTIPVTMYLDGVAHTHFCDFYICTDGRLDVLYVNGVASEIHFEPTPTFVMRLREWLGL
jgi:hypothetical protein